MSACRAFASLLTWLAFPVYVWQGLGVRRRTSRACCRPQGRSTGAHRRHRAGDHALVLGDSSAASVGVEQSENGLAAQLAH